MKKLRSLQRTWLPSALAGAFLLLSPFVVFIRYQNYPIFRAEIVACFALLAVVGAALGLLMELVGQYSRVVIFSFFITLLVDVQMYRPERTTVLLIAFGASLVITWFLRNHLARFGTFVLAVLFLGSFFLPTGHVASNDHVFTQLTPGKPGIPVVLHIILDEHIGVEGIPEEFDPDGHHAEGLRDFYLDHGFLVFGRAYSRYSNTYNTIPNLFNFVAPDYRFRYCKGDGKKYYLKNNRYFELMRNRGYQIHVYQTDYLDFCRNNDGTSVASCFTSELEAIRPIEDLPVSTGGKVHLILGIYSRLSRIMSLLPVHPSRVSAVSSMPVFDKLRSDLVRARPGMMFLVHIMLPHSPYAYEPDCQLRENPASWLNARDYRFTPRLNDAASRARRYPRYLEQLACTSLKLGELFSAIKDVGKYEGMLILVHGDHGSRISIGPPNLKYGREPLSRTDYIDIFSTLFAVKWPGVPAGYDRRILPLGPLFASLILKRHVPPGVDWAGGQHVFIKQSLPQMQMRPMPDFGRSLKPSGPKN